MTLKTTLLAGAAIVAFAGAAAAETPPGFYLDLNGGANWVEDFEVLEPNVDIDTGYFVSGSAGYKLDTIPLRIEAEFGWRSNDGNYGGVDGSGTVFSQLVNVLYDIDVGPGYVLSLGGGLGGARVGVEQDGVGNFDGRDYVFAYQGIAELEVMFGDRLGGVLGYNYFVADNFDMLDKNLSGDVFKDDYTAHTAYVGLRYHFYEPEVVAAPEPPPPPPPVAAKTFIVFFNFDRSDLTPEAQAVIAEAASAFKSTGSVSIAVVGHTDTVGSAAYNLPLSQRRAASVKSGLVANGVPADAIGTDGRGFSEPLVPTGPGVKEPQNRRATIDLTGSGT